MNVVHPPSLSVNESHLIQGSFLANDLLLGLVGGKWEANPALSAVDSFLLSQQGRGRSISKKSYLPSSGELGAPPLASSKRLLEQSVDQRTPVREHRVSKGGSRTALSSKTGRSYTLTAEPLIPLSSCLHWAFKGAIQVASWEQVPFGACCRPLLSVSSPPHPLRCPIFDSCGVAHCSSLLFSSGCYASPGFEDFPRNRSLCGLLLVSRSLPSAPVRSLRSTEPEGKQPWVAPSLPDAFLA